MKATKGSQMWLQFGVNQKPEILNEAIRTGAGLARGTTIEWLSPLECDNYVEYRDQAFIDKLNLKLIQRPLSKFWPARGPVWDGLARTSTGEVLLLEAKAHIPEMVSPASKASALSLEFIERALAETRKELAPRTTISWSGTFYQYTNRLAHLHLLRSLNIEKAHLVFLYFIGAADVGGPTCREEWEGAIRVTEAYLGLSRHKLSSYVHHIFIDVTQFDDNPESALQPKEIN
jgi:hypothetical protein